MNKVFKTYKQDIVWLESLTNLPQQNFMLGLHDRQIFLIRLQNFLNLLGNPEKKLKFIHITGTAGKGTTVGVLQNLIADAGLKAGSYTSPFSTTTIEKLKVNNKLISSTILHQIIEEKIKPALDKYVLKYKTETPSYFEIFLAIGFLYFLQAKCDWVILEAGLGGTHDATNVIKKPKITAITNIGLDHVEILGNTKTKIARDKAGIIKSGSYFLTSEKSANIKSLLFKIAKKRRAKIVELKNLAKKFDGGKYFATKQQKNNLNLALNILQTLDIQPCQPQKIIDDFQLICRQEIIQTKPLVILDGAHNADKLGNLVDFLKTQKYNKLHLILGLAHDKNYKPTLKKLLSLTHKLYLTRFLITFRKTANLRTLYQDCRKVKKIPTAVFHDPQQALNLALKSAKKDDLIIVTGSFFLAGELRKYWISEKDILKHLSTMPLLKK